MTHYVTYKVKDESLFHTSTAVGVPSGRTRIAPDGAVEAELICLTRAVNQSTTWIRRKDLIT